MANEPADSRWRHTLRYSAQTEAHVFALSITASVLPWFYTFLIVVVSLCKYAFRWPTAVNAVYYALNDYLPGEVGQYISLLSFVLAMVVLAGAQWAARRTVPCNLTLDTDEKLEGYRVG